MRNRFLAALTMTVIAAAALPTAGAQEAEDPPHSAIPVLERPAGSADPGRRVRLLNGDERPGLRARLGLFPEFLYRQLPDGSYAPVPVPTWQVLGSDCRRLAGDPRQRMVDLAAAGWAAFGRPGPGPSAVPGAAGSPAIRGSA